jgi:hypothetical protein
MWVQSTGGLILTRHIQKYLEKNLLQCNFFPLVSDWDWTQAFTVNSHWLTPSEFMCVYFWCVEEHICGDKWNLFPENWGILFEILHSNKAEGTTVWWEVMCPVSTRTVEEQEISLFIFPALCMQSIKKVSKMCSEYLQKQKCYRNLAQSLFLLKSVVAYVETVFLVAFAIIAF